VIPLEDKFNDILGKARRGAGLSFEDLSKRSGIAESALKDWEAGRGVPAESQLDPLCRALPLVPARLLESLHQRWYPQHPRAAALKNFLQIPSRYGDMLVNCYLAWDVATHEAALFDTGADFDLLRGKIESYPLKLTHVFLTHTHTDHVAVLDRVIQAWKPALFTSRKEYVREAKPIAEGESFAVGKLTVDVLETEGHSPGGLSFLVRHLGEHLPSVAVVGDAMFAGSIGGPMFSYDRLLENIRRKILSLPEDTVLAPGHGPLTTVGEEKRHNPFLV